MAARKPTLDKIRLLGEIANSLLDGFVVFHVDTDARWSKREESENRILFEAIVRRGVSSVLQGFAANPIGKKALPMTAAQAEFALTRLFVMHPCYSVESWLYQAGSVEDFCRVAHTNEAHLGQIAAWHADRTLLDEVSRPKDEALGECVGDRHNAALAAAFPASDVYSAEKSWAEFVRQLAASTELLARLA